jgi:hypothetical protein
VPDRAALARVGTRAFAEWMNPVIRGWMNYYGKFYSAEMSVLLRRINTYLVRWFAGVQAVEVI